MISYAIWLIYHLVVMNWLSVLSLANIGSMLCAAISDPFYGPDYRLHGFWHQFLMIVAVSAGLRLVSGVFLGLGRVGESGETAKEKLRRGRK